MKTAATTAASSVPPKVQGEEKSYETKEARAPLIKDTWVFQGKEYRMIEGAMPSAISAAFEKAPLPTKKSESYEYDRAKLSVYCFSSVDGPDLAARVELVKGPAFIADVIPDKDAFKIQIYPNKQGLFPLSSAEFLKAVDAAKLNIYMKTDENED